MTANQPPEQPGGSPSRQQPVPPSPRYTVPPPPGAPGYGQGYGQAPSWSAPPPGWGQQPPPVNVPPGHGPAGPGGVAVDLRRLRVADYVVAGGTLVYLMLALFPWWDYGDDFFFARLSGFSSGQVSSAFVLFLLATAWALLPAVYHLALGFPRAGITVGLAALGFLLTLIAWIDTIGAGFSIWALLGLLTAAAILLFAVLTLLAELRERPAPPPAPAGPPYAYGAPLPPPPPPAPRTGPPPGRPRSSDVPGGRPPAP